MSTQPTRRSMLGALLATGATAQSAPKKPNVLYYFADQVRVMDFGYNGGKNIPTPNIDRFSSQGIRFTNALSTCPLCTPYRAMLQTGRWPLLSGGFMNYVNLPPTGESIGDVFGRNGYDTGYIGKWHLINGRYSGLYRKDPPLPRVNQYVPPGPWRMGYQYWAAYNLQGNFQRAIYHRDSPKPLYMPHYETVSETDFAIDFIRSRESRGKPFFLMVAPHPPHPPWTAAQAPAKNLAETPKQLYWRPNVKGRRDSPRQDPRCYYAMLGGVDDNFGRLMKFLDESGLADNTIVVFTTDHGEMLASQGRYNKMVPYTEASSIPLVIRWPQMIRAGFESDALYTPMDHFPTLASLCGLPIPSLVNGTDLSQHVLGRTGPDRDAVLMMNYVSHWDFVESGTEWPEWRGVRTKQYTYVRWLNGAEELYDNLEDPYQMRNLWDGRSGPVVMGRLRARLKDLLHDSHDEFRPGTAFSAWLTPQRDLLRNALGPLRRQSFPAPSGAA